MKQGGAGRRKIVPLEGLRGIASLVVIIHHFILGFFPAVHGILQGVPKDHALAGTVYFIPINGTGAVGLFFVLSGYVLGLGVLTHPEPQIAALRAAAKRWFRLAGPVMISVLLSYALFRTGAYFFADAGAISNSPWLSRFAYGGRVQDAVPGLGEAVLQGGFLTFFRGDSNLNSNLWTMRPEFIGSLVVFALALATSGRRQPATIAFLLLVCSGVAAFGYYLAIPFLAGLATAHIRYRIENRVMLTVLVALALYLFGFYEPTRHYSAFAVLQMKGEYMRYLAYSLSGSILVYVFSYENTLSRYLDNSLCEYLGFLSFPLYLLHTLLICSIASWVFVHLNPAMGTTGAAFAALASLLLVLFPAAHLLALMDRSWTAMVSRIAGRQRV